LEHITTVNRGGQMTAETRKPAGAQGTGARTGELPARAVETAQQAVRKTRKVLHTKGAKVAAAAVGVAAVAAAGVAVARAARSGRRDILRVTPRGERWEVRVEGNKNPSKVFDTKEEAVAAAREMAHRRLPSELVIHRADGSEQDHHSYEV
jgi:hypothetical protein